MYSFVKNPELHADLLEVGCELYKEVVDQSNVCGQDPALDGKPLYLMPFRAIRYTQSFDELNGDQYSESIAILPLNSDENADPFVSRDGDFRGRIPLSIVDLRNETRKKIDDLCFVQDLNVNGILLPSTVAVEYGAYDEEGEVVAQMNTFEVGIDEVLAVRAIKLAKKIKNILSTNGIEKLPQYNIVSNILGGDEYEIGFAPMINAGLPLNGAEPTDFLRKFYVSMLRQTSVLGRLEDDLIARGGSSDEIDNAEKAKNSCLLAAQRAEAILNSRKPKKPEL